MANEETAEDGRQLVVFRLGKESYGIDVSTVREIFPPQEITRVPNAPEYVEGVINLRGKVVAVIDLRKRFGVEVTETTNESRIVVVEYDGEDVGVIVDAVHEVVSVGADRLAPATVITEENGASLAQGFARLDEQLVILVDIEMVLARKEEDSPQQALEAAA